MPLGLEFPPPPPPAWPPADEAADGAEPADAEEAAGEAADAEADREADGEPADQDPEAWATFERQAMVWLGLLKEMGVRPPLPDPLLA